MAVSTTRVEIDSELLQRLRERQPATNDRELLESLAKIALGREALRRVQERSGLDEGEATTLGAEAVREARSRTTG